jgi:hypothetical protein
LPLSALQDGFGHCRKFLVHHFEPVERLGIY